MLVHGATDPVGEREREMLRAFAALSRWLPVEWRRRSGAGLGAARSKLEFVHFNFSFFKINFFDGVLKSLFPDQMFHSWNFNIVLSYPMC